jgi:FkbM family methyltransferase
LQKLVFDVGMHKGFDAEFYLKKGFRVVAVEAAPKLCDLVESRLRNYVQSGQLTIVNRAIAPEDVRSISFYINPRKDDWGSANRHTAEKGMDVASEITVETTTLSALFDQYGVPYYLKTDIEGADPLLVSQLKADSRRPVFVSVETYSVGDVDDIAACGFDTFQIVNQWMHTFVKPPKPPREGLDIDAVFNGETSGLFGRDLDPQRWIGIEDCRRRFGMWRELHDLDENLAPGWCDVHACLADAIAK